MESDKTLFLQQLVPHKGAAEALQAINSPISDLETCDSNLSPPFNVKESSENMEIFYWQIPSPFLKQGNLNDSETLCKIFDIQKVAI